MIMDLKEISRCEICVFGDISEQAIALVEEKIHKKIQYFFLNNQSAASKNERILISDIRLINRINSNMIVMLINNDYLKVADEFSVFERNNIKCTHIDFYIKPFSVELCKIFKIDEFIDMNKNRILLDKITNTTVRILFHKKEISNCVIDVRGAVSTNGLTITLFGDNAHVRTGRSSFNKVVINISADSEVMIGDDCMFSSVCLHQSDMHHIFDLTTKKRINKGKNISIGNHVWVGRDSMIMGGAVIADGCILGSRATTAGKFLEKNCVIVGNPAKVIRQNVLWARDDIAYDYEDYSLCKDQDGLKYI